jgi:hypothetical protein
VSEKWNKKQGRCNDDQKNEGGIFQAHIGIESSENDQKIRKETCTPIE